MTSPTDTPLVPTIGDLNSPIWLLGDSPSTTKHIEELEPKIEPLDRRHPTRHTIWTPILDVFQRHLYKRCGRRLDDSKLYIQNAIIEFKDENKTKRIKDGVENVNKLLEYTPKPFLVLCFGQFTFECARRANNENPQSQKHWSIPELSQEFSQRISKVQLDSMGSVTLLPLLHQSAALQFWKCNGNPRIWGGNYFEYVGEKIADVLICNLTNERINELLLPVKPKDTTFE
ncbi:MAG: hypothetical protein WCF54_07460 [Terracidiphilus sp.]